MSFSNAVPAASAPGVPADAGGGPAADACAHARRLWRWWVWVLVAAAVLGAAVAVVLGTGMTPSFDAYGWLVWGHQLLYGNLNLNAAPSWKPLMIIFTLPMALLGTGDVPPRLLAIVTTAGTLATAPFAARIAYRLLVTDRGRRSRGGCGSRPGWWTGRRCRGARSAGLSDSGRRASAEPVAAHLHRRLRSTVRGDRARRRRRPPCPSPQARLRAAVLRRPQPARGLGDRRALRASI